MHARFFRSLRSRWRALAVAIVAIAAAGLPALRPVDCTAMIPPGNTITKEAFGSSPDGPVDIYTLRNNLGMEARIMTFGGIVVSLKTPDKNGTLADVVLGYDTLAEYLKNNDPHFGALIGRYGNRIAGGKFSLGGQEFTLAQNNGPNSLHGGPKGFDKVLWQGEIVESPSGPQLQLKYTSRDGEEGFPGELKVTANYSVTTDNALRVDFHATTDKETLCNLTHHSYFNLAGKGDILKHEVRILANQFTPVNKDLIPTGKLVPVAGTPFDFLKSTPIGARINADDEQIRFGGGYDHNWVIMSSLADGLPLAAEVYEPTTGRVMQVLTSEPGMQFYSGNFLDKVPGKGGQVYDKRAGFCMEPQHYPDSPNQPAFPSTALKPGERYSNTIIYKFSTR